VCSAIAIIDLHFAYLALAVGQGHVDKSAGVEESLAGAALRRFRLFLLLDLISRLVPLEKAGKKRPDVSTLGVAALTLPVRDFC
jgi:hypothetical protein